MSLDSNKMRTQLDDSYGTHDQGSNRVEPDANYLKLIGGKGQHIAKWIIVIAMSFFLAQTSQAVNTYYLTKTGATNAQNPQNWNTSINGDGTAATNFSTEGDIFLIPKGLSACTSADFIFGNYDIDNTVTLNILGELTIKDGTHLVVEHGGTNAYTTINIGEDGSIIFTGTRASQLYGNPNAQANKTNIRFNILKGGNIKTANINGISSGDGICAINTTNLTVDLNTAANYEFNGAGQKTYGLPSIVNNLTFSGTGAKALSTATQVNGIFSIENGSNINDLTIGLSYGTAATLQYNASASSRTVQSKEWITPFVAAGGVIIKGTGAITLDVSKQLGNNTSVPLNITSGAVLATNNKRLVFHGDFINNGTLLAGSSEVKIAGSASIQSIGAFITTGPASVIKTSGKVTITGDVSAASLNIYPSASLAILPAKTLTIKGTLTNDGTLTLQSNFDGTATLLENGISGTGTFKMEQYLTGTGGATPSGRGWYVSSPVNNATRNVFAATGNTVWQWDEVSKSYSMVSGGTVLLNPMQGYVTRAGSSDIVTFSGSSFNSGPYINTTLSRTGTTHANRGYHLIGNPYPSFLDWNAVSRTNIWPTIWYRTYNGSNMIFDTYNGFIGTNNSGNGAVNQFIPPMQAVWVLVDGDGNTGSLEFGNALRSHQGGNYLRSAPLSDFPILRFEVVNGTNRDETIVLFSNSASDSLDYYDSPKISNNIDSIPELYTLAGNQRLAINSLNDYSSGKELALGFKTGLSGSFVIKASEIDNFDRNTSIILTDKLLNIRQDLTEKRTYSFESEATNTSNRFTLTIEQKPTLAQDSVSTPEFIVLDKSNGTIQIQLKSTKSDRTTITIYNFSGRKLLTKNVEGSITTIETNLPKGFYLLEVNNNGCKGFKKIVINH